MKRAEIHITESDDVPGMLVVSGWAIIDGERRDIAYEAHEMMVQPAINLAVSLGVLN